MTLTHPKTTLTVVQVYKNSHALTHPAIDISKHSLCHAVTGAGDNFFIVSDPALAVGDTVKAADLEMLPSATKQYYLLRAFQSAASTPVADVKPVTQKGGYEPDVLDVEAIWKAHKSFQF